MYEINIRHKNTIKTRYAKYTKSGQMHLNYTARGIIL